MAHRLQPHLLRHQHSRIKAVFLLHQTARHPFRIHNSCNVCAHRNPSLLHFSYISFGIATPQQLPPPQKQWFDKIADALLGEDVDSSNSKFALICENCFNHNGLVREAEFDDMSSWPSTFPTILPLHADTEAIVLTEYVCPKCGHFNRSPKQKRELEEKHGRGGRTLRAVNNNQDSPPPTAMSSFPNSPEPYRSRFGDQTFSGLANIPEPSPSPSERDRSSSRQRGTDDDGDAEMRNAADQSMREVDGVHKKID